MSIRFSGLAAILISLPCVAWGDVYPSPVPVPPVVAPHRLLPRQVFHWLDTNHDGYLTVNEFLAAPWLKNQQRATQFFFWMDTNNDGLVSLPEFLAAYTRYSGSSGYAIRVAYPWASICWQPWQNGWYWHTGWHRRPGAWTGVAVHQHAQGHRVVHHAPLVRSHKHPHPVKHVKPAHAEHHGKHKGHGHGHGHAKHR